MTFSQQLLNARERLGYTQTEAAARLGLKAAQRWQEWESGTRSPPDYAQPLILDALRRWPKKKPR